MEVILKMTVTMILMGTWTWTKNREMKEKVGVALRNNFVHTGRAPKGLKCFKDRHNPLSEGMVMGFNYLPWNLSLNRYQMDICRISHNCYYNNYSKDQQSVSEESGTLLMYRPFILISSKHNTYYSLIYVFGLHIMYVSICIYMTR